MKKLLYFLPLLLLLVGCNNREDILLPKDLSAADYLEGSLIEQYSNYLIRSANDDSYLLVHKEAIADSLLSLGDKISFRKVQSFEARDSLALQQSALAHSDTYQFSVQRGGESINMVSRIPMATLYTKISAADSELYQLGFAYYLYAQAIQPVFYGQGRGHFPLLSTGDVALYSFGNSEITQVQHTSNEAFHALLVSSDGKQAALNFPAAYASAAGEISLTLNDNLSPSQQSTLQGIYPNTAISSPILKLQTASPTGSEIAYLRMQNNSKGWFGQQWIRLTANTAYSWPEGNPDTGSSNWWQDSTDFYAFLSGSGHYFLATPLESQTEFTLPLDGSYNQVFLQDLWFDLQNLALPNTSLKVSLNPSFSPLQASYFNGSPYNMGAQYQMFDLSFWEGSTRLKTLPNDAWIEFGFHTAIPGSGQDRLFTIYGDETEDIISYKTASDSYDAEHYSRVGNYIYTGIANSATYLYGACTETKKHSIPYLKSKVFLQSRYATISWDGSSKRAYSSLQMSYQATLPVHPWLQGEPFTLGNSSAIAQFKFYQGQTEASTVPANFLLALPVTNTPTELLLFSNSLYPRLKYYAAATTLNANNFVVDSGSLSLYPEFPGSIITASVNYANPYPLKVYPTMTFAIGEIRFYTYGSADQDSTATFNIERSTALSDPYNLLSTQYVLSQTSAAYSVTTADESNFARFEPVLFFARNTRYNELLFYENSPPNYRLYPYAQSTEFNPWYFVVDGGYNGIALAYNGSYASYTDNSPHSFVAANVNTQGESTILSLYQAQFVLPASFLPSPVPTNSSIKLEKVDSLPTVNNLLAAYQLLFKNASGQVYYPNFYAVSGVEQEPFIYVPVSDITAIPTARFFYRNLLGAVIELTRVSSFSSNFATEYKVLGNSFICTVPNPGWFYVTGQ